MHFHIITLFPSMFDSYLNESMLSRAHKNGIIDFSFYNPRDYAAPTEAGLAKVGMDPKFKPYLRVDDKAYGGGPGMVIQALPILKAVEAAKQAMVARDQKAKAKIIFFSPSGAKLDTTYAKKVAKKCIDIILICGRYEGIDARVKKILKAEELSVGDYVLTGGELPAMLVIDTVSRQLKGVLGDLASLEESRSASADVYTRPEILEYNGKKHKVPKVLLSGNHKDIEKWRVEN